MIKLYLYFQNLFWNLEAFFIKLFIYLYPYIFIFIFFLFFTIFYLKVGKIDRSEFQKLHVWRPGNRNHSFFIIHNTLSANWPLLKLRNSIKSNVWYLGNLEKLAIKMWFPFNFTKNLKDRRFVLGGSKNLKLSPNTFFSVSFQKNVLSSLLLFSSFFY